MRKVKIIEAFEGWPAGKPVQFAKGDEPTVSNRFAALITAKGHATYLDTDADQTADDDDTPAPGRNIDAEPAAVGEQKDHDA